jgi:hypothetical protein
MADRRQGLRGRGNRMPLSSAHPSYRANGNPISLLANSMEEGTKSKKTVFVGGIADDADESAIYEAFSTFGRYATLALWPTTQVLQAMSSKSSCLLLKLTQITNSLVSQTTRHFVPHHSSVMLQSKSIVDLRLLPTALPGMPRTRSTTWI